MFEMEFLIYIQGGGLSGTYFTEEGDLLKTSAYQPFCKRRVFFCTQVRSMGGENPLTIHKIYAVLTRSDSRSVWAAKSAAAKQAEDYKI